jgi:DNA primase
MSSAWKTNSAMRFQAAMIAPELIAKVRDAVDIVAVIGRSVALKKAGNSWKGLCPFHGEKTASFNVVPSKQMFHCFGCNEGGDVFAFLMKKDKLNFAEAVRQLAGEAGIEVEEQERDPKAEAEAREREELTRLLELAADWFRRNFKESPGAQAARDYAAKRGLSAETLERFQIGYAPAGKGALERAASQKGYSQDQLAKAGLIGLGEGGSYSRFRGRLMFPIQDARGRVVGFGGRILGDGEPKYLNSPETPLFSKSRILYGMPQAKDAMLKKKRALVTEGYMDAIACQQAGIHEAIAVLGTALTEEHARQLKRYVDQVLLVFDADQAGLRAALRGGEILLKASLEPRVLRLGEFKDPDEFIKARGREAFEAELENAGDAVSFFADALLSLAKADKKGAELSLRDKAAVMQQIFPLLARYATAMEAEVQLQRASQRLGLPEDAVRADFQAFKAAPPKTRLSEREGAGEPPQERRQAGDPQEPSPESQVAMRRLEMELLGLLVNRPDLQAEALAELPEPDFSPGELSAAARILWSQPGLAAMALVYDDSEDSRLAESLLSRLAMEDADKYGNPQQHLRDLLQRRQKMKLEQKAAQLMRRLDAKPGGEEETRLLGQMSELRVAIQHLKNA